MTNDEKQANDEKIIFERVITEEEIANFPHPNILVEHDMVTLKSVPPWIQIVTLLTLYAITLIIAFNEGLAEKAFIGCVIFTISTIFFLIFLIQQKVTTVFNLLEHTVYRRNPLYVMSYIPFAKIAEIDIANDTDAVYFKIVLKSDRLGKGVRISRNYDIRNEEFLYIIMKALPTISSMLEESEVATPETDRSTMMVERPVFYTRKGSVYTFTTWRNQYFALVASVIMLFAFACLDDWIRWVGLVMGFMSFLVAFVVKNRTIIDTKEKIICFSTPSGFLKTSFPLNRYSGMQIVREHINGIYTHTVANMHFHSPEFKVDFYSAIWTKTLSALVEETEAIISEALSGSDQSSE